MIVVGVDPGARHTGVVVLSVTRPAAIQRAGSLVTLSDVRLLRHATVERDLREPILEVSRRHLLDIAATITAAVRDLDVDLIGVEGLRKPTGFAGGKKHTIDPGPLIASGVVYGSIIGRHYGPELVTIPPGLNGSQSIALYPTELRPTRGSGRGKDKLRHERSAYDCAIRAPAIAVLAGRRGNV